VHVERAARRQVEQALAQDLAVGGDDEDVGVECAQGVDALVCVDVIGLEDRNAVALRQRFGRLRWKRRA